MQEEFFGQKYFWEKYKKEKKDKGEQSFTAIVTQAKML